ncbi:MAG: SEC-C metal-binding domain-containing protein [Candidatus Methylomirabilia bacterium]
MMKNRGGSMELLKKLFGIGKSPAVAFRPGRNESCWCGSGVKYKRCHMNSDQSRARAKTRTSCATS